MIVENIMNLFKSTVALALSVMSVVNVALADAVVGNPAPDFTLTDSIGKQHSLKDFKGKVVVLEWFNPECPFVKKHYKPGAMQASQTKATSEGAVWLTINSSAEGKQGHLTAEAANKLKDEQKIASTAILFDPEGTVGKAYGAKTTPHMFVVAADGTLAYAGAIDDTASADSDDIPNSKNYVMNAVKALAEGKKVEPSSTTPYGCSVKYKS